MVDNSPRPIAASHVLHRLLVPRHPPSALGNLTKRCSRPLCNSQPTTHPATPHTHHPPHPSPPHGESARIRWCLRAGRRQATEKPTHDGPNHQRLFFQDPTGCSHQPGTRPRPRSHHPHRDGCTSSPETRNRRRLRQCLHQRAPTTPSPLTGNTTVAAFPTPAPGPPTRARDTGGSWSAP